MKTNILNNLYQYFILNSKCSSKNHFGKPIYFCSQESCNKGYICSQCLKEDTEHFSQHVKNFIALDTKKNFFNFFALNNLDTNSYDNNDFDFNINYLKKSENYKHKKIITEAKYFYEYIKEYIENNFNNNSKNNFVENKNLIEEYITNEKEKERKINDFINNKINSFIKKDDKHKIIELIEQIKPYINCLNEKNKTKELRQKNKLEKIDSLLNDELKKIIEKCIKIFTEPENDDINLELNNLNMNDNLNTIEKNRSFYEGSINNISCIKTESNIEQEENEPKNNINTNYKNIIKNPNIIKQPSINDSFFKNIEEEYDNKNIENEVKISINKLPFNNYEFQQREKIFFNNKEKENSIHDNLYNDNLYLNPTISAANNFQFYNNNDLVNDLEIKLNKIHNNNLLNNYLKKSNMISQKSNNSVINISINNFQRKNSSNNFNNIKINNIYKSQREKRNNKSNLYDEDKLNIKTKNNISRLNKLKEQIDKLIN
jgi:hypothetical protein